MTGLVFAAFPAANEVVFLHEHCGGWIATLSEADLAAPITCPNCRQKLPAEREAFEDLSMKVPNMLDGDATIPPTCAPGLAWLLACHAGDDLSVRIMRPMPQFSPTPSPWVHVDFWEEGRAEPSKQFAIWASNGAVYEMYGGAVGDDPIWEVRAGVL